MRTGKASILLSGSTGTLPLNSPLTGGIQFSPPMIRRAMKADIIYTLSLNENTGFHQALNNFSILFYFDILSLL